MVKNPYAIEKKEREAKQTAKRKKEEEEKEKEQQRKRRRTESFTSKCVAAAAAAPSNAREGDRLPSFPQGRAAMDSSRPNALSHCKWWWCSWVS